MFVFTRHVISKKPAKDLSTLFNTLETTSFYREELNCQADVTPESYLDMIFRTYLSCADTDT